MTYTLRLTGVILFKKVCRESGLRLTYSEEELDFLEGEFVKNRYPNRGMLEAYVQRLGVDTKSHEGLKTNSHDHSPKQL